MKLNKKGLSLISLCLIAILLVSLTGVAMAQSSDNSWAKVKKSGVLVVGFCASYPPFESRKGTNTYEGFDVDLANALAKKLGVKTKFVDAEWQGLIPGLNKGDYDVLITCMGASETRGKQVTFSKPYYKMGSVVLVNKNNGKIKSKADLKGKVVGVQLGTADEMSAEKIKGLKDLKRYNNPPEVLMDLKSRRIDAAIMGYVYALEIMKKDKNIKIVGPQFDTIDIVMVANKNSHQLVSKLNTALDKVKAEGTYKKIEAKWLK